MTTGSRRLEEFGHSLERGGEFGRIVETAGTIIVERGHRRHGELPNEDEAQLQEPALLDDVRGPEQRAKPGGLQRLAWRRTPRQPRS